MNDFDDTLASAFDDRTAGMATVRPDFASVLSERQSRMRRRGAVAAMGIIAVGVSGMAAFAVGGEPNAPASDGPVPSDEVRSTEFAPGGVIDELWYCEGAVDAISDPPATTTTLAMTIATTIAPPTTISTTELGPIGIDEVPVSETSVMPLEDSGYFRHCEPVVMTEVDSAIDARFPATTIEVNPPPTPEDGIPENTIVYVVQPGDSPILVADNYGVLLDDLVEFNGWRSADEFPEPGGTVRVPAGSEALAPGATVDTYAPTTTGATVNTGP